jgi:hypothetical protein
LPSAHGKKSLLVEQTLAQKGNTAGLLGVLFPAAVQSICARQAIRVLAAGRLAELVGLGPGMTPAGDDFLAGALLAGINTAEIDAALPGTTPAGRTLLWTALRGSFPFYLCSFMERLAGAVSEEEIVEAVNAACSQGETSGTDALVGFCWMMRKRRESTVA